jgi:hypothetical protein
LATIDDDQMSDTVPPHFGQRGFDRLLRTNRDYSNAHDVSKAHPASACKRRAE